MGRTPCFVSHTPSSTASICCKKSQLLCDSHQLAPSSPDPQSCHLLASSPSSVGVLAWPPWSPLHRYLPPPENGFLSITQPPGSGLPHPQGHAPPAHVLGHTTDLSIAPQRPFQEPSDCRSATASPLPSVAITLLIVAQPISTAFPRLPPHPAEQFIIPRDEEYGGRRDGVAGEWKCRAGSWTTSWAQEDSGIQVMCVPFHLTADWEVTEQLAALGSGWPRPPSGRAAFPSSSGPQLLPVRQVDWQEGWGSFPPADAWRNISRISSWQ